MTSPLDVMRTIVGTQWDGGPPTPQIKAMEAAIVARFPDLAGYLAGADKSYFAWCGFTLAYCAAQCGMRPPSEFLLAAAWRNFGSAADAPQPGDVAVFDWGSGPHHVTLIDEVQGDKLKCLGGNQSHEVKASTFRRSQCIAVRRPAAAATGAQPQPSEDPNPFLELGATGPAVTRLQQLLGITADGDFGDDTKAAVITFQTAHPPLAVDGQVGPLTWAALNAGTPAQPQPSQPSPSGMWGSGKGSWYSQFSGKYQWNDGSDKPGSNALRVPDECQGISFYDHTTLGRWFELKAPNGALSIEQQTEIGPAPWTGRKIDISAACAERIGYSPHNFPTDAPFSWARIDPPAEVASLTPQQQAIKFRQLRKEQPMPDTTAPAPVPIPVPPLPPVISADSIKKQIEAEVGRIIAAIGPALWQAVLAALAKQGGIVLPSLPAPVTGPAAPPPATAPTRSGGTMGSTHVGVLGMLGTLAAQYLGGLGPFLGASASPTAQGLGALFGGLATSGAINTIGPTLTRFVAGLAALLPK